MDLPFATVKQYYTVQVLILTLMVYRWKRELYCKGSDSDTSGPHVGTGAILYRF